ncbi:MAG: NADH-ubiquinone oxidoreductase chain J [Pseudolabrys sp.]|jgi:NADH-quinone oxidoreductase subunit J|nr:NADH-ubiquinone oxidoreductase chain J [Pseudolabrys sp.]
MTAAFEIIAFAVFAFVAVAGALGMATTMSMFRSGIFLMASFMGVAGLFILLSADLIGLLQIMMYIGGMLVMILFMVLFVHDPGGAMMAGMDMALIERWFSKGLVPRAPDQDEHGGHEHKQHADEPHEGHGRQPDENGHRHNQAAQREGHGSHEMGGMDMSDMSMVTPARSLAAWLAVAVAILLIGMLLLRPTWHFVHAMPDPDSSRQVGQLLMEKYMVAFEGAGVLILIGIFGAVLLAQPSSHPDNPSRAAPVAVAKNPEPIEDDGLPPLPERMRE